MEASLLLYYIMIRKKFLKGFGRLKTIVMLYQQCFFNEMYDLKSTVIDNLRIVVHDSSIPLGTIGIIRKMIYKRITQYYIKVHSIIVC